MMHDLILGTGARDPRATPRIVCAPFHRDTHRVRNTRRGAN